MRARASIRNTTIIMIACVGFLLGIAVAKTNIEFSIKWVLLILPLLVITYKSRVYFTVLLFCLLLVFGNVRGFNYAKQLEPYEQLSGKKVEIYGSVDVDAQYNDKKQLEFDITNAYVSSPEEYNLVGKIKVAGFGVNAIYKGDTVFVEGKLYQTRGSRQASIGYASIEKIGEGDSAIQSARRSFAAGVSNVLPEPQAPFGLGLLIGQRSTLGEDATKWLAIVGLTHIIAVSGYNLTIIVRFVHRFFGKRSRYQTILFSAIIISLFLLVTGFSASIVRAAIVCGLSLLAWYYGRKFRPLLLLLITACITAGVYPIYLWSDIGWYLSFLAFFGVLILAPLITQRFFKNKTNAVTSAFIESLCAQVLTLPLIMYIFHEVSLISLIANVLVVPLVPLAMLLTVIAGIFGIFTPASLAILALPANIILSYILFVAYKFSQIPNITLSIDASAKLMIVLYTFISIITFVTWKRLSSKDAIITDEILI